MHIRNQEKLTEFAQRHPNTRSALNRWHELMERESFGSIVELREKFPHADLIQVNVRERLPTGSYVTVKRTWTAFNIGGNKARLLVSMQYQFQHATIRKVFTHAEYDAWNKRR